MPRCGSTTTGERLDLGTMPALIRGQRGQAMGLPRIFVKPLKMRPPTLLLSAVVLALVLALLVQHRRAVEREAALLKRSARFQDAMNERIREKSRENEILKSRLESLKPRIDREELDVRDRLPGLEVAAADAWNRANLVVVATYRGCRSPQYLDHFMHRYSNAEIEVKQLLKGESSNEGSMTTSFWLNERSELSPKVGEDYLVFIERTGEGNQAIKILRGIWVPRERLSGRVTHVDGRPAAGILVSASGRGSGDRAYAGSARTDADGRYQMRVYSEQGYVIAVTDDRWAAPYRAGVVVRAGKSAYGINFVLGRATRLRGRVIVARDGRPVPMAEVSVMFGSERFPDELRVGDRREDRYCTPASMTLWNRTDEDGRFEFHLGPGEYRLGWPRRLPLRFTIPADTPPAEIVQDLRY
jgi:hypothetical protein